MHPPGCTTPMTTVGDFQNQNFSRPVTHHRPCQIDWSNWDAEITKTTCAVLLLGNKTVMCDGPDIVLSWAEFTFMISCDGSWKSLLTSIWLNSGALSRILAGVINPLLVGSACEALSPWFWTFFDWAGCASTTWCCDFVCKIVMWWFMVLFHVSK